jgi:integrase
VASHIVAAQAVDVCNIRWPHRFDLFEHLSDRSPPYEDEIKLKQFAVPWLSVLVTLLAETGLRVKKEALPLQWSDVLLNQDPACIHIRESKTAVGVRTVWLTQHCREALLDWQAMCDPQSPYVFQSPIKPLTHITDYKRAWRKAAFEAGLPDRRIYDLRSTFASRANGCRATNLTVAHLLGHASTQILPTYVKPLDENTKAIIVALDAARRMQAPKTGLIN